MTKVKICGLRREEDIDIVNSLKPDYAGFIMTKGYKRSVTNPDVLCQGVDKSIRKVGVFVDDDVDRINDFISRGIIDIVQLHGNESVEYCRKIKGPIIKVFKPETFNKVDEYKDIVDYYLFDSGAGTGKTFDWNLLPQRDKEYFLAGGLSAVNLADAIGNVHPFAVDLSSSVEADGVKDYDKVKEIIDIVRNNYE